SATRTASEKPKNIFCRWIVHGSGISDETAGSGVHLVWRARTVVERMERSGGEEETGYAALRVRSRRGNSVRADLCRTLPSWSFWKVLVLDGFLREPVRHVDG